VEFDKPTYRTGDLVNASFTVTNVGIAPITRVRVAHFFDNPDELVFDPRQWAGFSHANGVTLEPGASHTVHLSGHQHRGESDAATLSGFVYDLSGGSLGQFSSAAKVSKTYGRASGIAFGDKNGNGSFDEGEELPGAELSWTYAHNWQEKYTTTANSYGHFTFPAIPTVRYRTDNTKQGSWVIVTRFIDVDDSDTNDKLRMRAVRPLAGELSAKMKFHRDSYRPGETAHVSITLTNAGFLPLTGIVAGCNRAGNDHALNGTGPGWGDLAYLAGGVTVEAGQTKTFEVSETVPDAARASGYVEVYCDFGYAIDGPTDNPHAGDEAKVSE
jgi:hypothetical protein